MKKLENVGMCKINIKIILIKDNISLYENLIKKIRMLLTWFLWKKDTKMKSKGLKKVY